MKNRERLHPALKNFILRAGLMDTIKLLSDCQLSFDCQMNIQDTKSHYLIYK
ncbi:MAG: hypothetical protein LN561_06680 [Rickettsia endosymbiont of Labidopullus appendiculatus]|nr:hypothetical protein [Rickettsia endosymbiont of Labidopullus appendiculatus]